MVFSIIFNRQLFFAHISNADEKQMADSEPDLDRWDSTALSDHVSTQRVCISLSKVSRCSMGRKTVTISQRDIED